MGMIEAYKTCIRKYAVFDGRARRSEYWYFVLCNGLILTVLLGISMAVMPLGSGGGSFLPWALYGLYSLFAFVPGLAVTVRRLHDAGSSGAYVFVALIPVFGGIILFVKLCQDSFYGPNQFGENPKNQNPNWQRAIQNQAGNWGVVSPVQNRFLPPEKEVRPSRLRASCIRGAAAGKSAAGEVVYIGRNPQLCQLVFPQNAAGVSRVHCMLHAVRDKIEVSDLGSSCGTFLADGSRLSPNRPVTLRNGDSFFLGSKETAITVRFE